MDFYCMVAEVRAVTQGVFLHFSMLVSHLGGHTVANFCLRPRAWHNCNNFIFFLWVVFDWWRTCLLTGMRGLNEGCEVSQYAFVVD